MAYSPNNINGQATMANSAPVTLASNQSALPITDNSGSLTVDNGGTFVVQENGAALTSLQLIDDTVFTDDTSTHSTGSTKGLGIMAVASPTDAAVDANDIGMVAMTTARALKNDLTTIAGTAAVSGSGTSTGALRVELPTNGTGIVGLAAGTNGIGKLTANSGVDIGDVDVTSVIPGTGATNLGKAEDAAHTTGDVGVMALAVSNEANTARAADGDYLPIATDTEGNVRMVGNRDSDAVDAGEPVKVGGQARTTNPTAVADADRVNFIADKLGKQVVVGSIRDLKANQITTITASTSETTVVTAVASTFMDVYGCIVVNSSATATNVSFKDSTAGTTRFNIYVPAGETRGFMLNESAAIAQTTVNNNWTATSSASVSSLIITMLTVKNT